VQKPNKQTGAFSPEKLKVVKSDKRQSTHQLRLNLNQNAMKIDQHY